MDSAAPRPAMQAERECGCPPWVVRCAHWDGQVLVLTDRTHSAYLAPCRSHDQPSHPERYGVKLAGEWFPCEGCGALVRFGTAQASSSDYAAALAEFHAREAALLGREVVA